MISDMRVRHFVLLVLLSAVPITAQTNQWTLTWSDEFDGGSLDSSKWGYDLGGNGWGNNEAETYTNRTVNLTVENGNLIIHALKEAYTGSDGVPKPYTSARIKTLGKFSQAYGRFEARIKIPYGQGIWPAFWMLGDDINTKGWPESGEIDIMENIGKEPNIVHGTLHGPGYSGANGIGGPYSLPGGARFADDFHVYAVQWDTDGAHWFVDNQEYFQVYKTSIPQGSKWVFDHPFHILLNVAVGGNWPGSPDDTTSFPQVMQVDYVRVYKAGGKLVANAVANGANFQPSMSIGSWFTVSGTDLATNTRSWRTDEIVDGDLPTSLDGTQVMVNGKAAYIAYISATQINALVPDAGTGPSTVTVVTDGLVSDPLPASMQTYAPAFFYWPVNRAVATTTDFQPVTSAKPGDVIILWGTGFGPTNPAVTPGIVSPPNASLVSTPIITLGSQAVEYLGGALAPGSAGLYQIAIRVPYGTPAGDLPLNVQIAGVTMDPGSRYYLTVSP
jgi:uncharacterized protein (TIGR03437 family)